MDNLTLQKIRELIDKNDKVGIAVGKNPTIDTMAAALTLSLGLSEYGKHAQVASASQPLVEHSSLVGIDKVKAGFEGDTGGDLVVSFPYHEGEIEKVSYTIDNGYLNIVVKAGEQGLTFNEADVKFRRGGGSGAPSLLFIVGTSRLSDLGQLFDPEALKNTQIVNIDNKPDNQGFGDVPAVMPNVASVSELIADLLYYLGVDITQDMAQNLMNGITEGTNNMQDPRVSYTTFELVANLMKKGASRAQTPPPPPPMPRPEPRMPQPPYMQRPQGQQPQPFPRPNMMPRPTQMPQRPQPARQNTPMPRPQPQPQPYQQQPTDSGSRYSGEDMGQPDMSQQPTQQDNQRRDNRGQDRRPPSDWLQPKVYKGSSNV